MGLRRWLSHKVNGIRPGFGEEAAAVEVAVSAANRRLTNWFFPLAITLLLMGVNFAYTATLGIAGWPLLIARIIFFDYLVFFFGWLAGWNAASRWRRDQDFLCELTTTPLSPAVVGNVLFAGSLGVWWKCILLLALSDLLMHVYTLGVGMPEEKFIVMLPIALPLWLPTLVVLAWFHLETMRLAHWMFAITALPGLNLIKRAVLMFIQILGFVTALTLLGSAITGAFFLVLMIFGGIALGFFTSGNFSNSLGSDIMEMNPNPMWHLAALGGLLGVGLLKMSLSQAYERAFWGRYLMFTWWGAAERNHPGEYPVVYTQRAAQYVRALNSNSGITKVVAPTNPEPRPADHPASGL
ncbi:hypothetical protein GC173_12025 [bacterium]|nr:hypothetical protein [bacterium]